MTSCELFNPGQVARVKVWAKFIKSYEFDVKKVSKHTLPWYKRLFNWHKGDVEETYIEDVRPFMRRYHYPCVTPEEFNEERGDRYYFDGETIFFKPNIKFWLSNGDVVTKIFSSEDDLDKWIVDNKLKKFFDEELKVFNEIDEDNYD